MKWFRKNNNTSVDSRLVTQSVTTKKVQNEPLLGELMKDGTIYAGISPDTNQPMYAAPADAPKCMRFEEAIEYAKNLEIGDKHDFRVPSLAELKVLFRNRDKGSLKGTFNLTGMRPVGYYMSSTHLNVFYEKIIQFSSGLEASTDQLKYTASSVRCIR